MNKFVIKRISKKEQNNTPYIGCTSCQVSKNHKESI